LCAAEAGGQAQALLTKEKAEEEAALSMGLCTGVAMLPWPAASSTFDASTQWEQCGWALQWPLPFTALFFA